VVTHMWSWGVGHATNGPLPPPGNFFTSFNLTMNARKIVFFRTPVACSVNIIP
jgi:hypothetical protein